MTTQRVRGEMFNAKSHLIQIEIYTSRKRQWNRICNFIITAIAILGAVAYREENYSEITFYSAVIVAFANIAKECLPFIVQPEDDLRELDRLHQFYAQYLLKLETIYLQRYQEKSDVDDVKLLDLFVSIKETEGSSEEDLGRLCRFLFPWEKRKIKEETKEYFNTHFPNNLNNI